MGLNIQFTHHPHAKYPWHWYYSPQGAEFYNVLQWLTDTLGPAGGRWSGHGGWLVFKDEGDAAMFSLKWS